MTITATYDEPGFVVYMIDFIIIIHLYLWQFSLFGGSAWVPQIPWDRACPGCPYGRYAIKMTLGHVLSLERSKTHSFLRLSLRCVIFELARDTRSAAARQEESTARIEGRTSLATSLRPGQLYIGQINIQSLKPKLLALRQDIDEHGYDVIVMNETWMRPSTPNRLVPIPGYQLHRRDGPDRRAYGGVAIAARESLEVTTVERPGQPVAGSELESLWAQIRAGSHRVMVCAVFRPPVQTQAQVSADLDELEEHLQSLHGSPLHVGKAGPRKTGNRPSGGQSAPDRTKNEELRLTPTRSTTPTTRRVFGSGARGGSPRPAADESRRCREEPWP